MNLVWKESNKKYVSGEDAFLGRFKVGGIFYDGTRPKNTEERYRAVCMLPGILPDLGNFMTPEEAKTKVENAVEYWIDRAGLNG